jgi:hypothetical protein
MTTKLSIVGVCAAVCLLVQAALFSASVTDFFARDPSLTQTLHTVFLASDMLLLIALIVLYLKGVNDVSYRRAQKLLSRKSTFSLHPSGTDTDYGGTRLSQRPSTTRQSSVEMAAQEAPAPLCFDSPFKEPAAV